MIKVFLLLCLIHENMIVVYTKTKEDNIKHIGQKKWKEKKKKIKEKEKEILAKENSLLASLERELFEKKYGFSFF